MTSPIALAIDRVAVCGKCGGSFVTCCCPRRCDVVLPLPPNMANGRMHWRAKDRKRKAYLAECDQWQLVGKSARPPLFPPTFAEIRALLTLWNPMDDDGAMARLKWSLDWLVSRGFLAGDSRKDIRWLGMPEQQIDRKHHGTVVFRITPVAHRAPRPGAGG